MGKRSSFICFWGALALLGGVVMGCSHGQSPVAVREKKELLGPLGAREDFYYWMRERENPRVLEHLRKENEFTAKVLAAREADQKKIFEEQVGRLASVEDSLPVRRERFEYFQRSWSDKDYPAFYRRALGGGAKEEILLDGNALAVGKSNLFLVPPLANEGEEWIAYAKDEVGRRFYTLVVQTAADGIVLGEIPRMTGDFVWGHDKETIFYTEQDPDTLRPFRAWRWNVRTKAKTMIYEEKDASFNLGLAKDHAEKFVYLVSSATDTTEWRYLEKGSDQWKVFHPRKTGHEYVLHDSGSFFLVMSNKDAPNFRLLRAEYSERDSSLWRELIPHRANVLLEAVGAFSSHWVLLEREKGLQRLRVMAASSQRGEKGSVPAVLTFPDKAYSLGLVEGAGRIQFLDGGFRYTYSSPKAPPSVFFYDFGKQESRLLKQKPVPTYDPEAYEVERLWVKSSGVEVPVVLHWRKNQPGLPPLRERPLLIQGYGSYGLNSEPYFDGTQVSLADRGFILATAQVRGGMELGRKWYEEGRLKNKQNTFSDFIAVSRALPPLGFGSKDLVFARGGSAGGLLMGAVLNQAPELYRAVVAEVPFVDVLTTMLDDSLPLTTQEYTEWGDPRKAEDYKVMAAYSPYDNVRDQAYPHVLATAGLEDSQVPYWEAAKWVAKLRDHQKGPGTILLKTELDSGHGGAAGRLQSLKDEALVQSFLLWSKGERR